jgi:hypothetical protein
MREDIANSCLILYAKPVSRRIEMDGTETVEFVIMEVLKSHPVLKGRKVVRLRSGAAADSSPYLLMCDEYRGEIDAFRGIPASPAVLHYFKGVMALDAKDTTRRLRHYLNYLDHTDANVAQDAFQEFTNTPDVELGKAARGLPPQKLRRWIEDPATPALRLRLYGFLLGHCGDDTDAARLHGLAQRWVKNKQTPLQLDGLLAGYALRAPKEGLVYLRSLLCDPTQDSLVRYSCLRALRYFHDARTEVIAKMDLLGAMSLALQRDDIADFAIEDLRKWKSWELTREILPLYNRPSHDTPIMRRAILRYALQCPRREAADFVRAVRRADPEWVQDTEELLRLEHGK